MLFLATTPSYEQSFEPVIPLWEGDLGVGMQSHGVLNTPFRATRTDNQ